MSGSLLRRFGALVSKTWLLWIIGWLCALVLTSQYSRPWKDIVVYGTMQHLPEDAPTREGERFYQQAFPNETAESNVVLVLSREDEQLRLADFAFLIFSLAPELDRLASEYGGVQQADLLDKIRDYGENLVEEEIKQSLDIFPDTSPEDVQPGVHSNSFSERPVDHPSPNATSLHGTKSNEKPLRVVSIQAPHNSVLAPLLISRDRHAMVVMIDLTSPFLHPDVIPFIFELTRRVNTLRSSNDYPQGLKISYAGSAMLGHDTTIATEKSSREIEKWTLWLVVILLVLVFRAPLVSCIPLVTLFCGVTVALNLLAIAAEYGYIELYDGLRIYVTVLVYGAAIDYALFLISRHVDCLKQGQGTTDGIVTSISSVGPAILISAATTGAGIGVLSFCEFGKISTAGKAIPFTLAITLFASLTLTFALLRAMGKWSIWPLPLDASSSKTGSTYERKSFLGIWDWVAEVIVRHPAKCWLLTIGLLAPLIFVAFSQTNNVTYDLVHELPDSAMSRRGNEMLKQYFSEGAVGPVTVLLKNEDVDFRSQQGLHQLKQFLARLDETEDGGIIADIRSAVEPLGRRRISTAVLNELIRHAIKAHTPSAKPQEYKRSIENTDQVIDLIEKQLAKESLDRYVSKSSSTGHSVAKVEIVLNDDPFSRHSIEAVDRLRTSVMQAATTTFSDATDIFLLGSTASLSDLRRVGEKDRWRMYLMVTPVVLLVLVVLMRNLALSVYLIATVLVTYLATIGATIAMTKFFMGEDYVGLSWSVPILLFSLLMAVSADYYVFLISRIHEEAKERQFADAIKSSVAATGGLIFGAGLVMAGTFSSLLWGGALEGMRQLGFALSFGILLDTTIICPLFVPSFLILQRRYGWKVFDIEHSAK